MTPLRHPLPAAQRRIWVAHGLAGGAPAYNFGDAMHLRGHLHRPALEAAVAAVIGRHDALRSRFPMRNSAPVAEVDLARPYRLPVVDLAGVEPSHRLEAALEHARLELRRPFDIVDGPPHRIRLVRLSDDEHVLVVGLHHIVCDAWSAGLLLSELRACYDGLRANGQLPALPAPVSCAAVAALEASAAGRERADRDLAYWRTRLAGGPPILDLAISTRRPEAPDRRGRRLDVHIPPALAEQLHRTGRRHRASPFMVLLAVLAIVLGRRVHRDDMVIATATAGRAGEELERVMGCLVNMVPLRVSLSGDPTLAGVVERARQAALEAFDHASAPFDRLADEVAPRREAGTNPLAQVVLQVRYGDLWAVELSGVRGRGLDIDLETSKFDLFVEVLVTNQGMRLRLEYPPSLFEERTIAGLARQLMRVLEQVVRDPDRRLSDVSLLTGPEREALVAGWTRGLDEARGRPVTDADIVPRLVELQVKAASDAIAVRFGTDALTYGELVQRADAFAAALSERGIRPEQVVAVLLDRTPEMVVALLGILRAGAAYLPLDRRTPEERQAFIVADSGASAIVAGPAVAARLAGPGTMRLTGRETGARPPGVAIRPDQLAYVIYTSGSTGRPKGTMLTHRGLANLVRWHRRFYGLRADDRASHVAGLGFDAAVWELWPNLCAGACVVLAEEEVRSDPERLLAWLHRAAVTVAFLPTPLAELAMRPPYAERLRIRALLTGGDRLVGRPPTASAFRLFNNYGPTEATVCVTAAEISGAEGGRLPSIGRPIAGVGIYVMDTSWEPVPAGMSGELCIAGAPVGRGYLRRPAQTADRFVPDPFSGTLGGRMYRTGDRGRWTEDGELEYLGRLDDQVQLRGFRIELGEVEAVLREHPSVREAAALLLGGPDSSQRLVAYVAPQPDAPAPPARSLREHLRRRLPEYMLPVEYRLLPVLPVTENGKLDRAALACLPEAALGPGQPEAAPGSPVERELAVIVADVLGLAGVSTDRNFFEAGGDSMLAVRLAAEARARGIDLDAAAVLRGQTVAGIAELSGRCPPAAPPEADRFALLADADRGQAPADADDAYPASMLQAGMAAQLGRDPSGRTYHHVVAYDVELEYRHERLTRVLARLTREHPILRSSLDFARFSVPVQVVHRGVEVPVTVIDVGPGRALARAWRSWRAAEFEQPFVLTRAPMLRVAVHRVRGAGRYRLSLSFHHAMLDAWSLDQLVLTVLRALTGDDERAEPGVNWAFRQFIREEQEALTSAGSAGFWRGYLAAAPAPAVLPAGGATRTGVPEGARLKRELPPAAARAAADTCQRLGIPMRTLCLGIHAHALAAHTGVRCLVTGSVRHGRPATGGALDALGLFINTTPIRVEASGDSVLATIERVLDQEREVLPHARVPFAALARTLPAARLETACTNTRVAGHELDGGAVRWRKVADHGVADLPLIATFVEQDGRLFLALNYRRERLDEGWVSALASRYVAAANALRQRGGR